MATFAPHTHPETTSETDDMSGWDVHTNAEQCAARMCTWGECWGEEDDALQVARAQKYVTKYGAKLTEHVGEVRAETARSQWSGDMEDRWF